MRCTALFLLPELPLYSTRVVLYLCSEALYSCYLVFYSCCVVLYSCCIVLRRVELMLSRVVKDRVVIDKVVSMLFSQRRSKAYEYRSTQLLFATEYQRWNLTGTSTLNQPKSFNVISTLFCQRSNNVDKHTSAQLSFSTKCKRWNNVDECWRSTLLQRWCGCWDQLPRTFFTEQIPLAALE